MEKLRVFEGFSGYGSQSLALKRLGIDYKVVGISEIDKFAIKSYGAIHGDVNNFGDISKLDARDIPDHDLFTYSFPCQDISVAGKMKGFDVDSGTRSSLLWECKRIIEIKKPRYLLLENVRNLVGVDNIDNFNLWLEWLESQGYSTKWEIVNSKHFNIPQNRERVIAVSCLDDNFEFEFPKGSENIPTLSTILEEDVDSKYNVSKLIKERFEIRKNFNNDIKIVGTTNPTAKIGQRDITYDTSGIMGALTATDYKQPKQIAIYSGNLDYLSASDIAVRRLTPKECGRLMGVDDSDIDKMIGVNSNTQLYTQFGNSIVVNILVAIFGELFDIEWESKIWKTK